MFDFKIDRFQKYEKAHRPRLLTYRGGREAAVGVPLIQRDGQWQILLEVRSSKLDMNPSEVCFPGGGVEGGETPEIACLREITEELLVSKAQIQMIGETDGTIGPNGAPIWAYVVALRDYDCTFSKDEVADVFLLPLEWLLEQEPKLYTVEMKMVPGEDFPYDIIPGGRKYSFRNRHQDMPFYQYEGHVIWGATARILMHFAERVRNM